MDVTGALRGVVARATMTDSDVRVLLRKDHEEALALAAKMEDATTAGRRKELLKKLKPALAAHSRAEEAQVYKQLLKVKGSQDSHDISNEGFVEHGLLDELLGKLASMRNADSDVWKANATVLRELLQHHVDDEHSEMFEELGEHFTSEQLELMGRKFLAAKEALL